MRPSDFDIREVINALQGTCDEIRDHLPEGMNEDDLTSDDYTAIDLEIFKCDQCDWWYEIFEENDGMCEGCHESLNSEDEEDD